MDQPSKAEITLLTLAGHTYCSCRPCVEQVGRPGRWYTQRELDGSLYFTPWRKLLYGDE